MIVHKSLSHMNLFGLRIHREISKIRTITGNHFASLTAIITITIIIIIIIIIIVIIITIIVVVVIIIIIIIIVIVIIIIIINQYHFRSYRTTVILHLVQSLSTPCTARNL